MWGLILTLAGWVRLSPVPILADMIGTTEPALKLLISIIMAYPMAIVYHNHVRKQYPMYKNIYFLLMGVDMAFYNFGLAMYHNAIPALVIFATTAILGAGKLNATITFLFNMTYLLAGYIWTESEDYDITWTMPHCVLTLKLIALAFDLWDGEKLEKGQELSENNKKTAVIEAPTIVELLGFVYFPSCFLVGPIFSFKRYKQFVSEEFPLDSEAQVYQAYGFKRLIQGIAYLAAFQVGVSVFSMKYMQSEDFVNTSILYRHFYCGLWAHFALYKYIACWLLTEASCARFGLSYNGGGGGSGGGAGAGAAVQGPSLWDGCNNIKLLRFESATRFQHYIDSFNCNTNHFAAEYVYKRLKFLNNRNLSQLFTLLFLALWHGTRSGYYVTFLNEFLIMLMEKELEPILLKTTAYHQAWEHPIGKYVLYGILKMYTIVFMGWSLVPFDLKTYTKWWPVYSSLWFSGFILFVPWSLVYKPALKSVIKKFNLITINEKIN